MNAAGSIQVALRGHLGRFALDAAFTVPARGITALFGPSGCGKTTVLRCMAGLHRLPDGLCLVDGEVWQDREKFRPPHRRPVGYVFQEASLFPHLSVRRNLLFGASRGQRPSGALNLASVVDLLGLAALLDRAPHHLSGGERQRVAIGRALLSQPKLLLMDEPLSALDRPTRAEIVPFLQRLHAELDLPIIYVSHDMAEVEQLADTLVLMEEGRVVTAGPLGTLQADPRTPIATARDAAVSLEAAIESFDAADGLLTLQVAGLRFLVPGAAAPAGDRRRLRIAAGDVSLARTHLPSTILNVVPSRILDVSPAGSHEILVVLGLGPDGAGPKLLARITRRSWRIGHFEVGDDVFAQVKGVALAS